MSFFVSNSGITLCLSIHSRLKVEEFCLSNHTSSLTSPWGCGVPAHFSMKNRWTFLTVFLPVAAAEYSPQGSRSRPLASIPSSSFSSRMRACFGVSFSSTPPPGKRHNFLPFSLVVSILPLLIIKPFEFQETEVIFLILKFHLPFSPDLGYPPGLFAKRLVAGLQYSRERVCSACRIFLPMKFVGDCCENCLWSFERLLQRRITL